MVLDLLLVVLKQLDQLLGKQNKLLEVLLVDMLMAQTLLDQQNIEPLSTTVSKQ